MHVLVCGGAGYIGSHTAKALAKAGHVPVVFDSMEKGHDWAVQWGPLVEGDLSDRACLRHAFETYPIGGVIQFAAYIAVGESVREPEKYFKNNVANTLNLLGAMKDAGVKPVVFSSTAAVYGMPNTIPIPEDHPKAPVNPYGESKLMVEQMLAWWGFSAARLRYFNAAGADPDGQIGEDHDPETHLIPLALAAASGRHPQLELYGTDYPTPDGTAVRDYIHVTDLAQAHVLALDYLAREGKSFAANLGTGKGYSVREVIKTTEAVTGLTVPYVEKPRRDGDPAELVADSRLAQALLGWQPKHSSLEEIIATAWTWYRKHHLKNL